MGRKPSNKQRISDPSKQEPWLEAAFLFFQQKGLEKPSMNEVAAHLGISKATLYKYFRSKEELIGAALRQKLSGMFHFTALLSDKKLPYFDRYYRSLEFISNELDGISNLFLAECETTYPKLWELIQFFQQQALSAVEAFYREGAAQGELNNASSTPILVALDELYFNALTDAKFLARYGFTIKAAFEAYYNLKLNGILPQKARVELHK